MRSRRLLSQCVMMALASASLAVPASGANRRAAHASRPNPRTAAVHRTANMPVHAASTSTGDVQSLGQAYKLLASANHDYQGHRAKAMKAVAQAARGMGAKNMGGHGTGAGKTGAAGTTGSGAKASTATGSNAKAAGTKASGGKGTGGAGGTGGPHEDQAVSDQQLQQAQALIQKVKGTVTGRNQITVVGHLDQALEQLSTALTIK